MGCDIHMVVQVRKDGRWLTAKVKNPEYKSDSHYSWEREWDVFRVCNDRDYDLFGILADVRNGTWGQPTESIAPCRGLPEDFELQAYYAGEYKEVCDDHHFDVWMGDHSHTWMTLKEILDFNWDQVIHKEATVSRAELERMTNAGESKPQNYCAWSSGENLRHKWTETYREVCSRFWDVWMPVFLALDDDPANVRLVMGFDS